MTAPESRLPGPERSPGFLLWRVTLAWQRAMRAALAPHDLTHVQFVLLTTTWWLTSMLMVAPCGGAVFRSMPTLDSHAA